MSEIKLVVSRGDEEGSIVSFIGWERLFPYIAQAIGERPHEKVTHIEVRDDGIKVYLKTITPKQ